MIDNTVISNT